VVTASSEEMAKRNPYDGRCSVCNEPVRAFEGVVEAIASPPWYRILCPEHTSAGLLDSPTPPEASKLPSIHMDEERFER
jgi:hypothetical protein